MDFDSESSQKSVRLPRKLSGLYSRPVYIVRFMRHRFEIATSDDSFAFTESFCRCGRASFASRNGGRIVRNVRHAARERPCRKARNKHGIPDDVVSGLGLRPRPLPSAPPPPGANVWVSRAKIIVGRFYFSGRFRRRNERKRSKSPLFSESASIVPGVGKTPRRFQLIGCAFVRDDICGRRWCTDAEASGCRRCRRIRRGERRRTRSRE